MSAHLRKFCDYIVFEVSSIACDGSYVNKCVDAINDMIWKYNIVTFDRLVLCLVSGATLILCISYSSLLGNMSSIVSRFQHEELKKYIRRKEKY